jgi:hypothetical protein
MRCPPLPLELRWHRDGIQSGPIIGVEQELRCIPASLGERGATHQLGVGYCTIRAAISARVLSLRLSWHLGSLRFRC